MLSAEGAGASSRRHDALDVDRHVARPHERRHQPVEQVEIERLQVVCKPRPPGGGQLGPEPEQMTLSVRLKRRPQVAEPVLPHPRPQPNR